MHIMELMDGVDGEDHLGHIEPRHVLRKTVLKLAKQSQQVPAHVIIHHQILRLGSADVNQSAHMAKNKHGKE